MTLTREDVERLMAACRQHGVQQLDFEGLRLKLHDSAFAATTRAAYPEPPPEPPASADAAPVEPPRRGRPLAGLPGDDALFDHVTRSAP